MANRSPLPPDDTARAIGPSAAPGAPAAPGATGVPWDRLPEIDLRQLLNMTDDTGMFQHAWHAMPDPNHGYCIDDNARALIAALYHAQLRGYNERVVPLLRYLAFLRYAYNDDNQRFRNFMGYDRSWLEAEGSTDSQGRTLWALGLCARLAPNDTIRDSAVDLFIKGLPALGGFKFIRSLAFALIGLHEFLQLQPDHGLANDYRRDFAQRLADAYQANADESGSDGSEDNADPFAPKADSPGGAWFPGGAWPWWEDTVTYDNAKLCQAMILAGRGTGSRAMIDVGLRSLRWLLDIQTGEAGQLSIVGNNGWYPRGGEKAAFDQQPLEAHAMVEACLLAAEQAQADGRADDRAFFEAQAWRCFEWFTGRNDVGVSMINPDTGACHDGLLPDGVNKNQGAESVLAYLLSVLQLRVYRQDHRPNVKGSAGGATPAVAQRGTSVVQPVGFAILGASKFAEFCLENYRDLPGLVPTAIWNRTTANAADAATKFGLKHYENLADLLADPAVHLVHIGSTPNIHAEQALAALDAGKHVLCEKPVALTPADAQAMIDAAGKRDRQLAVNHVMRYGPLAGTVKAILDAGILGAPLRGVFINRAGDGGLPSDHWFWDPQVSGGIFVEHGVHFFDLVHHWLANATQPDTSAARGAAPSVLTAHRTRRPGSPVVDQVACDVRYGEQCTVSYYHGFTQASPTDQQDFRLVCERGQVRVVGWVASAIHVEAVLDNPAVDRLATLLPDARVETLHEYPPDTRFTQRWHPRHADRYVALRWQDHSDKQAIYGRALAALMDDLLHAIRDPRHRMRITPKEALAALDTATEADRLAAATTP